MAHDFRRLIPWEQELQPRMLTLLLDRKQSPYDQISSCHQCHTPYKVSRPSEITPVAGEHPSNQWFSYILNANHAVFKQWSSYNKKLFLSNHISSLCEQRWDIPCHSEGSCVTERYASNHIVLLLLTAMMCSWSMAHFHVMREFSKADNQEDDFVDWRTGSSLWKTC